MYQQAITHRPFLVWWVLNLKVKALVAFSAFGMVKSAGEEFTIEDSGKRLDLEKLGWIRAFGIRNWVGFYLWNMK